MGFVAIYARVLGLLQPERRLAVILAVANIGLAGIGFIEPILFGRIIDVLANPTGATPEESWSRTIQLLVIWIAAGSIGILANILVALHADRLAHRRRLAAMALYFEHVMSLPAAFHSGTHSGALLKIMLTGADNLFGLWLSFFREHLSTFVAVLVLLPLSLYLNWRLGLLLIALIIVFALVSAFVVHRTEGAQRQVEDYHSELAARAGDALGNVVLVQSFVRLALEVRDLAVVMERLLKAQFPVLNLWALMTVLSRMASTITIISIFVLGSWLHLHGQTSVGEIVSFMGFATMLISRLEAAMGFVSRMFFQMHSLDQFFSVLDTEAAVRNKPGAAVLSNVKGDVVFDHVTLSYNDARPAVIDLTFEVPAGTKVALVGPTGSGKTSSMALLSRLWDPQSGRILIDGVDIRDVTLESLRQHIGVVFQDSAVFHRTIADNIRIGRPEATDAEVEQAAKLAQAHDFIMRQPQGYATMVGERGVNVSGGERQRLAIARALLKNPPILILDEATSALDAATEARIQQALDTLMQGRTTFIIAHRLATVRQADQILVLNQGRIVERGSFDELVEQGGLFADLVRTQFAGAH
ncbi:glucan ABC transporter ATP-binding protein/ permease [uncultured Ferrovibrio sp.]|jgi:glucan exporter ATP-binding protein|uniref:glucan ABC transporter ATP-binding protein/ permease n=1 Tax=uncultured Ferrovibrio sp. TaxID=1576913 RepID=UPI0026122BB6|nr:glucan ABC transporter ATP-binding protein/ permease [uncultured Ferrovibrio sp.]